MSNDEESVELLPAVADGEQKTTRKKLELRLRPRSQIFSLKGGVAEAVESVYLDQATINSRKFDFENTVADAKTPFSAYVLLISAVVGLSSIGPLLQMQSNVDSILKIYWRMSATAMALLPFAVKSVHKEGFPMLTLSQVFSLVLTAASYACMCSAFVISLNYTSVGNAVIFSNSQSLILLIAKLCIGETVLLTEGAGAIVAFCGAALCSRDSAGASPDGFDVTLYGDGLALLSAFAGVRYLVLAKSVRKHVTLHVFMFLVMAIGSTLILMTMVMLLSTELSFDRHLSHGIFGWMNLDADRFPLEICMVILCNVVGAMGYVRAMHYFDTLVISVSTLLEPIIAEVTAFSLGVGLLPGLMGWIGNAMVILGTFAVVLPTARKNNSSAAH